MGKERRGFASATPERLKEISKKGSDAAKLSAHRHAFTSEQAREAAKAGLKKRHANILTRVLGNREGWATLEVRGKTYSISQLRTPFWLHDVRYPSQSWLVWEVGEEFSKAMTDSQFHLWKIS